jgi:hypothetical protein
MQRDPESIDSVVRQMADRLASLEARVTALEQDASTSVAEEPTVEPLPGGVLGSVAPAAPGGVVSRPDHVSVLALFGRTFLILGGAYLLRALTHSGTVPAGVGVALALAYAGVWFALADRGNRRGHRLAAEMYGVAAALIAFPVIVEAVERFEIFGGTGAVVTLAAVTAAGFAVALRNRLEVVAWAVTLGALGVAVWAFLRAGSHLPTTGFVIALGVGTAVIARSHGWVGPRWPAAVVADLMVLVVAQVASRGAEQPAAYADVTPVSAVGLAVALIGAYLAVVAVSTLVAKVGVSIFDAVQVPLALVVGVGGITAVVRATSLGGSIVGGLCVALGFACYGVAFVFVDRRLGRNRTFFYYTSLGLLLVLAGVMLPASAGTAAMVWGLVGLVMAVVGARWNRITLRVHAAVFLCGAAVASGLPGRVVDSFREHAAGGSWIVGSAGAVLLMVVVGYLILAVGDRRRDVRWNGRLPRFAVLLPAVAGLGAVAVVVLSRLWPGGPPAETVEAGIRGLVLSAAAIALAAVARRSSARELGWLVYPVLLVAGIRLLMVDLRLGSPSELVVSFGAFGIALILAPGLLRGAAAGPSVATTDRAGG